MKTLGKTLMTDSLMFLVTSLAS